MSLQDAAVQGGGDTPTAPVMSQTMRDRLAALAKSRDCVLDAPSLTADAARDDSFILPALHRDSTMKRILSFVKRLRAVSADSLPGLLAELDSIKVDRYLAEMSTALLENMFGQISMAAANAPSSSAASSLAAATVASPGAATAAATAAPSTNSTTGSSGASAGLKRLSSSDLDALLQVLQVLHARFGIAFTRPFVDAYVAALTNLLTPSSSEREERDRVVRCRHALRFVAELYFAGFLCLVSPPSCNFTVASRQVLLAAADDCFERLYARLLDAEFANLSPLCSLLRVYGAVLLLPVRQDVASLSLQMPSYQISPSLCDTVQRTTHDYFQRVVKKLQSIHTSLLNLRHKASEWYYLRGCAAPDDLRQRLDASEKNFQALYTHAVSLSAALALQPPVFSDKPEKPPGPALLAPAGDLSADATSKTGSDATAPSPLKQKARKVNYGVWDDEEARDFYETLPNLELCVPASLLSKYTSTKKRPLLNLYASLASTKRTTGTRQVPSDRYQGTAGAQWGDNLGAASQDDTATIDDFDNLIIEDTGSGLVAKPALVFPEAVPPQTTGAPASQGAVGGLAATSQSPKDAKKEIGDYLDRLSSLSNAAEVDAAAIEFCSLNTRYLQNCIAAHLLKVRKRPDLIPYYARYMAILRRFPFVEPVAAAVERALRGQIVRHREAAKLAFVLQPKLANAKYIGELVKFRVIDDSVVFFIVKLLLEKHTLQNVEVLVQILVSCGSYLHARADTHVRFCETLERIEKLKLRLTDSRLETQLESAIAVCRPFAPPARKHRSVHELYLRHLIQTLAASNVRHVAEKLCKYDWASVNVRAQLRKHLTKLKHLRHDQAELLACVLYIVSAYYPGFVITVIDTVIENIQLGVEASDYEHNQVRLLDASYLAYMCKTGLIGESVIGGVLEYLISGSPSDTMLCYFPIRLVLQILEICHDKLSDKYLDKFLTMFQFYVSCKSKLPADVEFLVQEFFEDKLGRSVRISFDNAYDAAMRLLAIDDNTNGAQSEAASEKSQTGKKNPKKSADCLPSQDEEKVKLCDVPAVSKSLDAKKTSLPGLEKRSAAEEELAETDFIEKQLELLMNEVPTSSSSRRRPHTVVFPEIRNDADSMAFPATTGSKSKYFTSPVCSSGGGQRSVAVITKKGGREVARRLEVNERTPNLVDLVDRVRAREEQKIADLRSQMLKYEDYDSNEDTGNDTIDQKAAQMHPRNKIYRYQRK